MTRERCAESKNCEILRFPTAETGFNMKVKCPTAAGLILGQTPQGMELNVSRSLSMSRHFHRLIYF